MKINRRNVVPPIERADEEAPSDRCSGCLIDRPGFLLSHFEEKGVLCGRVRWKYLDIALFKFTEQDTSQVALQSDHMIASFYQLACSPKSDPDGMRVSVAQMGKETLDDGTTWTQTAQPRADHRQAA